MHTYTNAGLALALLIVGTTHLFSQYMPPATETWNEASPDGRFGAAERIMPDPLYIWNTDLDTARLVVRTLKATGDDTYVSYDLPRLIAQIEWSPDSRYLVMTTVSAGGHSPWHFNSYVYSVTDKSLRYVDDVIGLVEAPDLKFVGGHTLVIKIRGTNEVEQPTSITVDLSKLVRQMKKLGNKHEGSLDN